RLGPQICCERIECFSNQGWRLSCAFQKRGVIIEWNPHQGEPAMTNIFVYHSRYKTTKAQRAQRKFFNFFLLFVPLWFSLSRKISLQRASLTYAADSLSCAPSSIHRQI